jgi:hypothetical protein
MASESANSLILFHATSVLNSFRAAQRPEIIVQIRRLDFLDSQCLACTIPQRLVLLFGARKHPGRLTGQSFLIFQPLRRAEVVDRHPGADDRDAASGGEFCHRKVGVGTSP